MNIEEAHNILVDVIDNAEEMLEAINQNIELSFFDLLRGVEANVKKLKGTRF